MVAARDDLHDLLSRAGASSTQASNESGDSLLSMDAIALRIPLGADVFLTAPARMRPRDNLGAFVSMSSCSTAHSSAFAAASVCFSDLCQIEPCAFCILPPSVRICLVL